jgi:hypothetical protein
MSKQQRVADTRTAEEPIALKGRGFIRAVEQPNQGSVLAAEGMRIIENKFPRGLKPITSFAQLAARLKPRPFKAGICAAVLCLVAATAAPAQKPAPSQPAAPSQSSSQPSEKAPTHITPEQAKQLFALVDELLKFSSQETGLPIKSTVKRQITTRPAVEKYLKEKFDEDESAKRLQRGEIVLKKFGLLDRDFALKPFLLALLDEQIEAFYDSKTKTVNMLDWVDIEEQKPVLAHELTHALQDQHADLEKWSDQTPDEVSLNASGDTDHVAKDEMDTAREAVAEGQATAVMMDYILKPMGKSLVKDPEVMDVVKQQMTTSEDSPILSRAPLLLSESLLFPYREGLSFEQDVWMDQGQAAAFAGALDNPPTSSWEILNPREYEKRHIPAVPLLPDIHPLVDKLYKPYDIGQMGQLDVHILTQIYAGDNAARDLTPAWDGGLYWAGQRLSAKTPAEQASTNSLALFYLSAWKSADSARTFAQVYANNLGRMFSGLKPDLAAQHSAPSGVDEQDFTTTEGPVIITTRGKLVFVSESFPLDLARKLAALILDAQGTGELKMANRTAGAPGLDFETRESENPTKLRAPSLRLISGARVGYPEAHSPETLEPLTANLIRFFTNCGVMKAAVDAEIKAAAR